MLTMLIVTIVCGILAKSKVFGVMAGFVLGFILAAFVFPGVFPPQMTTTVTNVRLSTLTDGSYIRAEPIRNGVRYFYLPENAKDEKSLDKSQRVKFTWMTDPSSVPTIFRTDQKASSGLVWLAMFPPEESTFIISISQDKVNYSKVTPTK